MFEFFDFLLKLWYNSPPENIIKIMIGSGVTSGCLVFSMCKFLEKRKKSMGETVFKIGDRVKVIKDTFGSHQNRFGVIQKNEGDKTSEKEYKVVYEDKNSPEHGCFNMSEANELLELAPISVSIPLPTEYQQGDQVKVLSSSTEETKRCVGYTGNIERKMDRDGTYKVSFGSPINDYWYFQPEELQFISRKTPEVVKAEGTKCFKVGDYVKVISKENSYSHNPEMDKTLQRIGIINGLTSSGKGFKVKFPSLNDWWNYSDNCLELSSLEAYNKDNGILTPNKKDQIMSETKEIEWTLFKNEVPTRRDIEISEDGTKWRVKTKTETKAETKGTEPMKTESKIKVNWIPVTSDTRPVEDDQYLVLDDEGDLYCDIYCGNETEDTDSSPSEQFDEYSSIAFFVPINSLKELIQIPSKEECKKVYGESKTKKELETLTMNELAENFSSYSKEKQAKIMEHFRSKGLPV